MAVAHDVTSSAAFAYFSSSVSASLTVGANDNRALVAFASRTGDGMTTAGEGSFSWKGSENFTASGLWANPSSARYLLAPSTGSGNASVTYSNVVQELMFAACSIHGVDQSDPIVASNGATMAQTISVSTVADGLVVAGLCAYHEAGSAQTNVTSSNTTSRLRGFNGEQEICVATTPGTGGSVASTWSGSLDGAFITAFSFRPAPSDVALTGGTINATVGNGAKVYGETVAEGLFGDPPYSYAWEYVSGDAEIEPTAPNSATTQWTSNGTEESFAAVWRVEVTDDNEDVAYSANVSINVTHAAPKATYKGKGSFASGSGNVTPTLPGDLAAGDLLLLFVESANQAASAPSGWTAIPTPSGNHWRGTAGAAGGVRIDVFHRWWQSGDGNPTVSDTGDHTTAIIHAYADVDPDTPFDAATPIGFNAAASTTLTMDGITTQTANALVVHAIALDRDANSTTTVSGAPTNANLIDPTERHDQTVSTGAGGGLATFDGRKATAGATGNTTATQTSNAWAGITLSLRSKPEPATDIDAEPGAGALAITGHAPALAIGAQASPGADALAITGHAPQVSVAVSRTAEPGAGALSLAGQPPALAITARASPEAGALALEGHAPGVSAGATASPDAGALALAGNAPAIAHTAAPAPAAGALGITGHAPTVRLSANASPEAGALALQGQAPGVSASATAAPMPALLTIAGHAPAVQIVIGATARPDAGALALEGHAPAIARSANAAPGRATLAIIGNAPVVIIGAGAAATPDAGALAIDGKAPTLRRSAQASPAGAALALSGHAPNVHIGSDTDALPPAGALALTGHAPSVRRSANVSPPRATLTITGFAPALAITGNAVAQPGAGALCLAGFAPGIDTGQEIAAPATGRVTITGHPVTLDQTANSRITPHALDEAARIIGEALEIDVAREPIGALDGDADDDGVRLVAALSEGSQTELGYAIGGGYRSFEFEQRAAFELLAVGGDEDQRRASVSRALVTASNAIAAHRRLGGLVDHADLEQPDPTDEARYAALAAVLVLTFTAPTALG